MRLRFEPQGWDLSFQTRIWASGLGFGPRGGGETEEKKEKEEEKKEKFLLCVIVAKALDGQRYPA